jgi:hypothetical protein
MSLNKQMKELELIVKFNPNIDKNSIKSNWCDDIELFLDYDTSD